MRIPIFVLTLALGGLASGEFETWTSSDGRRVTMKLLDVEDREGEPTGKFSLRNGRVVGIKASDLNEDGARRLSDWPADAQGIVAAKDHEPLFTRAGDDPSFAGLLESGKLRPGANRTEGVTGSKIDVVNARVETTPAARRSIANDIRIHTLAHSSIRRQDFPRWSRWYQEDGSTQVFRLFKGEENVRNQRQNAARIEAFSSHQWKAGGGWHEWSGTYTLIKPHSCAIFQVKNRENDWAVNLGMNANGDVSVKHRRGESRVIAKNMTGKPFDIRVRDNGHDYEVYLNEEKVASGAFARPAGNTSFRWGMYLGKHPVTRDAMIFVSGATIRPARR